MEEVLHIKNVSKVYEGKVPHTALKNINLHVDKGEFVAIIGPSGSGKSTLLTIAGGLQSPTEGEVFINGKNFSNVKEKQRSALRFKELGFILQASNLIPFLTVNDQLKLVNKVEKKAFDQKATDKLLEDLGVLSLKNSYPKDLSGGERQRVAIARALYHHPSVILADEPTASLDSEKAFEVVEILAKETKEKQKATIMVTHDQRLIERCDKVYEMRDGILKLL